MKLDSFISTDGMKEWREHWRVVLVSMLGYAVSVTHIYSLGVMIEPLEAEFGWSRVQISAGHFIVSMFVFPLAPVMGMIIDRFGPRRVALIGVAYYCAAIAALSLAQPAVWTWYALWMVLAFGVLCLYNTVWVSSVTSLFDASRGVALAVTFSAAGITSFAAPVGTDFLVENFGWRAAYMTLGGLAAIIALPLLFMFFSSAKDKIRKSAVKTDAELLEAPRQGLSFVEGLKSPTFVKLAIAAFLLAFISVGLLVNLVPILTSLGRERSDAALIAGLVGLTSIVGRLSGGYLLDHFNARIVGSIAAMSIAISCLLIANFGATEAGAITAVLILGLAVGAEIDVLAFLTSRVVGVKSIGGLFGFITGLLTLGTGLGPVAANAFYDSTGSYNLVLWGIIPPALIVAVLLLKLGPYPDFSIQADARVARTD